MKEAQILISALKKQTHRLMILKSNIEQDNFKVIVNQARAKPKIVLIGHTNIAYPGKKYQTIAML